MSIKKIQPFFSSTGRLLLCLVLGVLTAWLLRQPWTSLLMGGKEFAGRSLPVQAGLLFMFSFVAALLYMVVLHFFGARMERLLLGWRAQAKRNLVFRGQGAVLISLLIFIGLLLISNLMEQVVVFEDYRLEVVVRDAIGKPQGSIYQRDLLTLAELDASGKDITSLEGIEYLRNLVALNIENNWIEDLRPLGKLARLQNLNLRNNAIEDIAPLARMSRLVYLNLHSNAGIRSITPIGKLINLETLILRNVPVGEEIHVLRNLTRLYRLNLRNCGITDISVLGELMAGGALQNQPAKGIQAVVNILGNPLPHDITDGYAEIRPFWDSIRERIPFVLPYFATLEAPSFSLSGGFYEEPLSLEISTHQDEAAIHYTLDGSEPTRDSPVYHEPLFIQSRLGDPNDISAIDTTSPGWMEPDGEVFKATVVRAKAFHPDRDEQSATITHTYFVGEDISQRYTLPVVSISTDSDYLFDGNYGIYTNYDQKKAGWERPVHIEFFETDGQRSLVQNTSIRIHGAVSRRYPSKSLRIYANNDYDDQDYLNSGLFKDLKDAINHQPIKQFKTLLLRNSGNDFFMTMFRDALVQSLVSHTSVDTQAYRPVIVFINGEYWGILNLRERYDEQYLASTYQLDPNQVVILELNAQLFKGTPGDEDHYRNLIHFIESHDMANPDHYSYVNTQMDVENFIDYQVAEIYINNTDWPHVNNYYWRLKTDEYRVDAPYGSDGRWRWMLYDTDQAFGRGGSESYKHNTLIYALEPDRSGFLLRSLLENPQFRIDFINRFADHLNTSFESQRVITSIDEMQAVLEPEMGEHIRRWRTMEDSIEVWKENVEVMRTFALQRPRFVRQHIVDYFGLSGTARITLKSDPEKGTIRINSIEISEEMPGVYNPASWTGVYFRDVPVHITAQAKPGFRFTGWEGEGVDDPELEMVLNGDMTLQALFDKIE